MIRNTRKIQLLMVPANDREARIMNGAMRFYGRADSLVVPPTVDVCAAFDKTNRTYPDLVVVAASRLEDYKKLLAEIPEFAGADTIVTYETGETPPEEASLKQTFRNLVAIHPACRVDGTFLHHFSRRTAGLAPVERSPKR